MKTIISRSNEEIKLVSELHNTKGRKEHNLFLAEGLRTCTTLIKGGMKIKQIYTLEEHYEPMKKLANYDLVTVVPGPVMEKISALTTPSGIVATFEIPAQSAFSELKPGLVLAQISDPGNMGTLIRTASALNITNVVIVEGADVWSPKVIQATAGTIAHVKIFSCSWDALVQWKKDLQLCALVVKGGKAPHEIDAKNLLLVVGNEATGIAIPWLRNCNSYMTIPMPGKAESLNAAVAGSIASYLAFASQPS